MYPPAMCYEIYKAERGLVLTDAERRAGDEHAGEMAAAFGRQWRGLVRFLTPAGRRQALSRWNVLGHRVTRPIPLWPIRPGGASIVPISAHKTGN
jgi:hypothetical protein